MKLCNSGKHFFNIHSLPFSPKHVCVNSYYHVKLAVKVGVKSSEHHENMCWL
jgi:hypothetical protein